MNFLNPFLLESLQLFLESCQNLISFVRGNGAIGVECFGVIFEFEIQLKSHLCVLKRGVDSLLESDAELGLGKLLERLHHAVLVGLELEVGSVDELNVVKMECLDI